MTDEPDKLVSIEYFVTQMLGYKAKSTYYQHMHEPGWPQRVYPGSKAMLVLSECEAYIAKLKADRTPAPVKPPKVKRHTGRPAKLHPLAEGGAQGADNGTP